MGSNTNTCHFAEEANMDQPGWIVMPESCPGAHCSSYSTCGSCMADDLCMHNSNTNTCHFAEEANMGQAGWVVMPESCPVVDYCKECVCYKWDGKNYSDC